MVSRRRLGQGIYEGGGVVSTCWRHDRFIVLSWNNASDQPRQECLRQTVQVTALLCGNVSGMLLQYSYIVFCTSDVEVATSTSKGQGGGGGVMEVYDPWLFCTLNRKERRLCSLC